MHREKKDFPYAGSLRSDTLYVKVMPESQLGGHFMCEDTNNRTALQLETGICSRTHSRLIKYTEL